LNILEKLKNKKRKQIALHYFHYASFVKHSVTRRIRSMGLEYRFH
jgi:hypothetical protein